jgi:hypothetical protein
MSFPEYLKGRISEEYKNLILQKLQEVKEQVDGLDGVVDSSLSEANSDLRNSLERQFDDIRQNLDNQLNQAREKISASLKSAMEERNAHWNQSDVSGFQPQMDSLVSDIVVNVPAPPKLENEDLKSLTELSSRLDQAATQSDVLNTLLDHISGWVDRAVLFVIKGNQATGWASVGLGWDVHKVRMTKIELDREHVLSRAVLTGVAAYGPANMYPDNNEVFLLFGEQFPESALAFPILVRGKSAGILYADMRSDLNEKPDVPNLLFLASRIAGLCIDALPLKKPVPSRETVPVAPRTVASQIAVVDADDTAPHATVTMPLPKAPEVTDEDQKLHDEAKRFARLLVSEIKLYNEAQVSAGREHKDLYDRLKDDIERSRRMYMDRIPTHIHSSTNYFYEELVRTLANGDPTLLGM